MIAELEYGLLLEVVTEQLVPAPQVFNPDFGLSGFLDELEKRMVGTGL